MNFSCLICDDICRTSWFLVLRLSLKQVEQQYSVWERVDCLPSSSPRKNNCSCVTCSFNDVIDVCLRAEDRRFPLELQCWLMDLAYWRVILYLYFWVKSIFTGQKQRPRTLRTQVKSTVPKTIFCSKLEVLQEHLETMS